MHKGLVGFVYFCTNVSHALAMSKTMLWPTFVYSSDIGKCITIQFMSLVFTFYIDVLCFYLHCRNVYKKNMWANKDLFVFLYVIRISNITFSFSFTAWRTIKHVISCHAMLCHARTCCSMQYILIPCTAPLPPTQHTRGHASNTHTTHVM